jgi:integrase
VRAARISPRSVRKYHTLLHSIFDRAIIDQVIIINPCAHTVLPKFVKQPKKAITPEQFDTLLAEIPQRYRVMVLVAIETGVRWGELAALRPVDIDLETGEIHIRRVVLEVTKKITGADKVWTIRDYPKDNEHRTIRIGDQLCQDIREHQMATGRRCDDLLFSTSTGSPVSRRIFRTPRLASGRRALEVQPAGALPRPARCARLLAAGRWRRPQGRDGPPRPQADPDHPAVPGPAPRRRRPRSCRLRGRPSPPVLI